MRVLVIGASGYYGAEVAKVLTDETTLDVLKGRRKGGKGWVAIVLTDPSTFLAMKQADLTLNCADTVGAPAYKAIQYCLEEGLTFFEMGADAPTIAQILQMPLPSSPKGRVLVGVGIFPGFSTLLADYIHQQVNDCQRLDFAVRLSPFSGAGKANCALMTQMLAVPSVRYQQGERLEGDTVGETVHFPFQGVGTKAAVQVGLPDADLIFKSTEVPEVTTFIGIQPSWMRHNFRFAAWMLKFAGPVRSLLLKFSEWSLLFLRALLLRKVNSRLHLTALANRGLPDETHATVVLEQGQRSVATSTASAALLWQHLDSRPAPGLYTIPQVFSLEAMLQQMQDFGHTELSGFKQSAS